MHFSAVNRKLDFDLWTGPPVDPTDPPYVMRWALEPMTEREEQERRQREKLEWRRRVVVDDTRFYTHRYGMKGLMTECCWLHGDEVA